MATPTNKKTMMDVSKPGKTPASATARPIIVSHGPAIKDPMVNPDTDVEAPKTEEPKKEQVAPSESRRIIEPLVEEESPEAKEDEAKEKVDDEAPEKDAKTEESEDNSAVVDAVIEQVTDKQKIDKLDEADQKRQELVEKLVTEKKYFVTVGSTKRKRNNRIALVILTALLPLIVGVVLAVDAGIIETNITLPFDLIKQ